VLEGDGSGGAGGFSSSLLARGEYSDLQLLWLLTYS